MIRRPNKIPPVEVQQLFKQHFGYQPTHTATAPYQVELLGNHGEPNEGLVLCLAVNRFVQMAAAPRHDGRIELVVSTGRQTELFWLSSIEQNPQCPWSDPLKGVLMELRKRGVHFGGFNAAIHLPVAEGPGQGRVEALQVATALMVRKLYPYRLTETGCMSRPPTKDRYGKLPPLNKIEKIATARLCQMASLTYSAEKTSLAGLLTALYAQAFHASLVDCRMFTVENLPMHGEVVWVLCPSGVEAPLLRKLCEERRLTCESAAGIMRAKSLRSVDLPWLSEWKLKLADREYACAYHIVGENQRVIFGERALREGDFIQFGQYLTQSHESSRDFFQNSCPELDLLVNLACEHPGCLGARLTGPGWGGTTLNLVSWTLYEDFIRKIQLQYEVRTGRRIMPVVCQMVDGAE